MPWVSRGWNLVVASAMLWPKRTAAEGPTKPIRSPCGGTGRLPYRRERMAPPGSRTPADDLPALRIDFLFGRLLRLPGLQWDIPPESLSIHSIRSQAEFPWLFPGAEAWVNPANSAPVLRRAEKRGKGRGLLPPGTGRFPDMQIQPLLCCPESAEASPMRQRSELIYETSLPSPRKILCVSGQEHPRGIIS